MGFIPNESLSARTRRKRTQSRWSPTIMEPDTHGIQRNWNPAIMGFITQELGANGARHTRAWQACNPAHKNPVSMEPFVHGVHNTWNTVSMHKMTPMSMEFITYGIQDNCSSKLVRVEPCIISGLVATDKWICYSFLDNLVISIYSFYTNNIY